ncbi:hypothetical protein FRC12_002800 [Ceratobasidium sp. 428]|nr:hypothetical protein FRC12_002800 [Ceratobasidium sp. 428]
MATKTLNFYSYNLQKDTSVVLMFQPPATDKLFKDQFPVVWKVITFRARGDYGKATVKYAARLAFGYAQTDADNLVDSGAWTEVRNNSSGRTDLSIGFVKGDGIDQRFEPTLVWTGVGAKSNITAQFTPVLRAYVTRDYQASQLLRGEVETDTIWEQNINELNDVTGWNFQEDNANGGFSITPAGGA